MNKMSLLVELIISGHEPPERWTYLETVFIKRNDVNETRAHRNVYYTVVAMYFAYWMVLIVNTYNCIFHC